MHLNGWHVMLQGKYGKGWLSPAYYRGLENLDVQQGLYLMVWSHHVFQAQQRYKPGIFPNVYYYVPIGTHACMTKEGTSSSLRPPLLNSLIRYVRYLSYVSFSFSEFSVFPPQCDKSVLSPAYFM